MGPLDAIKTCIAKSFQFSGRASRSEFWWFAPFWQLGALVACFALMPLTFAKVEVLGLFFLLTCLSLPTLAVSARRAADAGFDVSWVGYSFSALFFAFGLYDIFLTFFQSSADAVYLMPYFASVFAAAGLIALIYIMAKPSRPNPHEVPS